MGGIVRKEERSIVDWCKFESGTPHAYRGEEEERPHVYTASSYKAKVREKGKATVEKGNIGRALLTF